ncbi:hypothetical protein PsorP6_011295 [Peronosclerospora sorghi]|uniref:Uncharacterized protein n=1 Tax=Peronosclerospora sorghi TaxID=230839 RepID=A0ACC0WL89_9STRA|nr:hypothetical protein PsorP6_011295 [Peronosclerospora sorghi]
MGVVNETQKANSVVGSPYSSELTQADGRCVTMQGEAMTVPSGHASSTLATAARIYREGGFSRFYRSIVPRGAARNEDVFLKALQNTVQLKRTDSGRTYVVPRPEKTNTTDTSRAKTLQPLVAQESATSGTKSFHNFPKYHKHHAHVIVHKIIGRIHRFWSVEKQATKQPLALSDENEGSSEGMCVGVY